MRVYEDGRIQTSIRIPSEMLERLDAISKERCISRNLLISAAIDQFLDGLDPVVDIR